MSVTTRDIFGGAPAGEPATPGSYGEAPGGFRLPAQTSVGAVTLQVADLERSLEFYRETLGLALLEQGGGGARLGAGARPLVELRERRGARPAGRGRLGLFHNPIGLEGAAAQMQWIQVYKNLAIAGGLLAFTAFGSGPLALEARARRPRQPGQLGFRSITQSGVKS